MSAVPAGWKLVPIEPDEAMSEAGASAIPGIEWEDAEEIFRAMLAAAPAVAASNAPSGEDSRVAFERISVPAFRVDTEPIPRKPDGTYHDYTVEDHWQTWQEAVEWRAAPGAQS